VVTLAPGNDELRIEHGFVRKCLKTCHEFGEGEGQGANSTRHRKDLTVRLERETAESV
jgi:hypothetical protein